MYHSLQIKTFPGRGSGSLTFDTYKDFFLVPTSVPIINPPSVKTKSIEIPGANGVIDLTESLTSFPVYNDRTGSIEFAVLNNRKEWYNLYKTIHGLNDQHTHDTEKSWAVLYSDIVNKLHGRKCQIILEDDPNWYYEGRIAINSWKSSNSGGWPTVTLDYTLRPYKLSVNTSLQDSVYRWKWSPFSFVDGVILKDETIDGNTYKGINTNLPNSGLFYEIVVDSNDWVEYAVVKPDSSTQHMNRDLTGWMPVCPSIRFSAANMGVKIENDELGYTYERIYEQAGTKTDPECLLYDYMGDGYSLYFKGHGTVRVSFRKGSL